MSKSNQNIQHSVIIIQEQKIKMFVLGKLRGFGCKAMAMPISADAQGVAEKKKKKKKRRKNKKKSSRKARKLATNLADTADICCAPPGISYLSDVIPRPDMNAQRTTAAHFQHSRVARRRGEHSHANSASDTQVSRQCHDLYIRSTIGTLHDEDQHRNWRLDTEGLSYEELVDLGDRIGYVNRGLCEKEIYQCLKIPKLSVAEAVGLLKSTDKDWRCSICQGGYRSDKEVGQLGCGHCHHISCIRQWLRQKNECPICKIPPMAHESRLSSD